MAALSIGATGTHGNRPKSVAQITKDAQDYEYNALVPMKYWLRSATALIKQAEVYIREGDDEMTYFLLFRHAHLVLTNLETHSEAKKHPAELKDLNAEVKRNLKTLDVLKPRLNERYERYLKLQQKRLALRHDSTTRQDSFESAPSLYPLPQVSGPVRQVRSGEDAALAARLAEQEFTKRASSRPNYASGGTGDDLVRRMQAIRMKVDSSIQEPLSPKSDSSSRTTDNGYSYPSVPMNHAPLQPQTGKNDPLVKPSVPAKVQHNSIPTPHSELQRRPPPKPIASYHSSTPVRPDKVPSLSDAPQKGTVEPTYSFAPEAYLENGTPLRTIFLPPTLRTTFLRLAHKNTQQNLETCGFLAGSLRANALFVTTLIIPSQTATSDTCEMTNESDLFDYVDQHELMVLGWIHTHPTQTCFMSSRDLHTHAGYQMMLAESIAVVCAPSKGDTTHGGDWGVYRLTDPPGKMTILQCEKPGIFHPHEVDNIYTDAKRPGHVREIPAMDFEIVDLRGTG